MTWLALLSWRSQSSWLLANVGECPAGRVDGGEDTDDFEDDH